MVSKRKRESDFICCDGPKVPRARRSIRKKSFSKETPDDNQLCAFDLLATVAGKLLEETDTSSASSNAAVVLDNHNISGEFRKEARRADHEDQGSSEESGVCTSLCLQKCTKKDSHKEIDVDAKVGFDVKSVIIHRSENECNKRFSETDGGSPKCGESLGPNVDSGKGPCQDVNTVTSEVLGIADKSSSVHRNDVKVDFRDDDDILSQLSDPRSHEKAYRSPKYVADSQIRKLITYKNRKSAPKLKESSLGSKRSSIRDHGRFQHSTPFKKRKLFDQSAVITHDGDINGESVSNTSDKTAPNTSNSLTKPHAGNIISSSSMDCQQSSNSTNSHVKLSIKSFIVPELLLEVPESTTVGSLKKAVMDAITTVLGGGLNVGVLLDGKKIRDDNRTLQQTGLSENDNLDDLGFILEPCSSTQLPPNSPNEDPLLLPTCHSPKDYVNRSLKSTQDLSLIGTPDKICKDLVPFSLPELENKPLSDSKALVPVPEKVEPLSTMPMIPKLRCSEIGQRRTRRPFTVSEVEALVHAVEKLGTGRWRDVKLCSFENAKHRTYVDLKDKWKTLVHTARISPQQRRGEPVPQELLDRVLAAHGYWAQHHSRQQGKHQELQLNHSEKVAA